MIISEVLDAIDNINSITIESEISMCESLLSSYDKMSLLEEYYEGDDINGFKIFQEGVLSDAKDDVKKQNEGKSTLNKILFTIPRMIAAIVKQIINLLKGTKKKAEDINKRTKALPKETKNLLAKLFPKKSDGKVNVKEAVKNWGIVMGAGAAATAGVVGGNKLANSVIASKNNKKITEQFIKNVKVDDDSKKKLREQMLALVTYVNDYYIDAIKKSYGKISKFKKLDNAKQVEYCFNIKDQLKSDNKCKELCEPLRQYREDLYSTSIKELQLKIANGKIVDMEFLVGATIINHLGVIKIGSTGKQKVPPVKLGSNPNEMIDIESMEKIIKNIPPDANIKIEIDSDEPTESDSKEESSTKRLAKIEELVKKIKDDREYAAFTLVYQENVGFIIDDTHQKNIDTDMRHIIFHYNKLKNVKELLAGEKDIVDPLDQVLRNNLRRNYSDNADKINIPSEFKYSDTDLISRIPDKITKFLSNSEYVKNCDELTTQIRNNIDKLSISTEIKNSIKDTMVYYRSSIMSIQEHGVIINKIIKEVNDLLTSIDNAPSDRYNKIDSKLLNKSYLDQDLNDYVIKKMANKN